MAEVFIPYSRILGQELEVQFTEIPVKNVKEQEEKGVWAFGVYAADPTNQDVWVHEFTEWAVAEIIEGIVDSKRNINAVAHIMASFHTVSGKGDFTLQTPEEFAKNLHRSKYKCMIYRPRPQKRLDRYFFRLNGGKTE